MTHPPFTPPVNLLKELIQRRQFSLFRSSYPSVFTVSSVVLCNNSVTEIHGEDTELHRVFMLSVQSFVPVLQPHQIFLQLTNQVQLQLLLMFYLLRELSLQSWLRYRNQYAD